MIIKFNGETTIDKLGKLIELVAEDMVQRAGLEPMNMVLRDCQIGVLFDVNGELNYLNVEHDGVNEILQINVQLSETGDIVRKVDNEEKSFQDDYTRNVLKGLENPSNKEIESVYNDDDLTLLRTVDGGDLKELTYKNNKTDETVKRYYRNNILIGEMGYKKKEEA